MARTIPSSILAYHVRVIAAHHGGSAQARNLPDGSGWKLKSACSWPSASEETPDDLFDGRLQHHALVLGAGGVGHALAKALAAHPQVASVAATHRGPATERMELPTIPSTSPTATPSPPSALRRSAGPSPQISFYAGGFCTDGPYPEKAPRSGERSPLASYRINAIAPLSRPGPFPPAPREVRLAASLSAVGALRITG